MADNNVSRGDRLVFSLMLVVLVPLLIISFSAVVYGFYLTLNWLPTQMLKDISRAETSQLPFVVIADSLFALVIVGTYLLVFGVTIWGASCAIKSVFQKR